MGAALGLVVGASILRRVVGDSLPPIPEIETLSDSAARREMELALVNLVVEGVEHVAVHRASSVGNSPITRARTATQRATAVAALIVVIAAIFSTTGTRAPT